MLASSTTNSAESGRAKPCNGSDGPSSTQPRTSRGKSQHALPCDNKENSELTLADTNRNESAHTLAKTNGKKPVQAMQCKDEEEPSFAKCRAKTKESKHAAPCKSRLGSGFAKPAAGIEGSKRAKPLEKRDNPRVDASKASRARPNLDMPRVEILDPVHTKHLRKSVESRLSWLRAKSKKSEHAHPCNNKTKSKLACSTVNENRPGQDTPCNDGEKSVSTKDGAKSVDPT